MIPLVHEVVDLGWISESQFSNMIGLSEITPGPIALNMATFVGASRGGFFGGVCATFGVVLPSFVIICLIAALLSKIGENKLVKGTLKGTTFVAIGLIASITIMQVLTTVFGFNNTAAINTVDTSGISFSVDWQSIKILGFLIMFPI